MNNVDFARERLLATPFSRAGFRRRPAAGPHLAALFERGDRFLGHGRTPYSEQSVY